MRKKIERERRRERGKKEREGREQDMSGSKLRIWNIKDMEKKL